MGNNLDDVPLERCRLIEATTSSSDDILTASNDQYKIGAGNNPLKNTDLGGSERH